MKLGRREFIAGGLSLASSAPADAAFQTFMAASVGGGTGGGMGSPQLQVAGVFATGNRSRNAKDFYTPGNESPGISTSEYYHEHACQFLRPWDLDTMGAPGAAVKAANGGNRYVWFQSGEHPLGGTGIHTDSWSFVIGFSNDPDIFPTVAITIIPCNNQWTGDAGTPGANGTTLICDMAASSFVYNPDDASFPFYLYTQGLPQPGDPLFGVTGTQSIVWKSSDLYDWVGCAWGPKSIVSAATVAGPPLTSFQNVKRNGTGDWETFGIVGHIAYGVGVGKWVSTDGKTWTYASSIYNSSGFPSVNLTVNAGSGTPNRVLASSAIFSPSDDGKGAILYNGASDPNNAMFLGKLTYVDSTHVDITGQYGGGNPWTFTAAAAPFEFGTVGLRRAPAPDGSGGTSAFGALGAWGETFTPGNSAQLYQVVTEDARHEGQPEEDGMWVSLAPIDANYNVSQVVPAIHVSSKYVGNYPGSSYIINTTAYREDGIEFIRANGGYPGPFATAATPYVGADVVGGVSGTTFTVDSASGFIPIGAYVLGPGFVKCGQISAQVSGTPNGAGVYTVDNPGSFSIAAHTAGILINSGNYDLSASTTAGRFDNQFVDTYTIATDSRAASRAAPFGVSVSCASNVATIAWRSTPLGVGAESQSYDIYRGTSAATQATFVGNTSSNSITDSPTPGQQYWWKVVKVSGGVAYPTKNRVVHTYVG